MVKKIREEKVPSIQVADKKALQVMRRYVENYLIKDSEYKRLSLE